MPPAPGQEEPLKRMTKIVNALVSRQDCAPFREPVDWRGLELYDYPKIISNMMDLGTIKRRLERGQYLTAHQVAEDVRLVWSNCMTYNADGSDFWLLAKSYARRFEDRYRKVRNEFDVGETVDDDKSVKSSSKPPAATKSSKSSTVKEPSVATPSTIPSLDARARFGADLFLLSGVELGQVMTSLELECPDCLETWGESKVEIDVDKIPMKLFDQLNQYVSNKVGTKTHPDSPEVDDVSNKKKKRKT